MTERVWVAAAATVAAIVLVAFFGPKPGKGPKQSTPLFVAWVLFAAAYPLFLWFRTFDIERVVDVDGLVASVDVIERPQESNTGTTTITTFIAHVDTTAGTFDVSWPTRDPPRHVCLRVGAGGVSGGKYLEGVRAGRCSKPE
jgi:hypothetical protein